MLLRLPRNATPRTDGKSLCIQCNNSQIIRTVHGKELTYCHRFDKAMLIMEPVEQCSKFKQINEPTVSDYEELAWIIDPGKNGRKAGFVSPKDYKKLVKDGKVEELDTDDPLDHNW